MAPEAFGQSPAISREPSSYERLQKLRDNYLGLNRQIEEMTARRYEVAKELLEVAKRVKGEAQTDIAEMERLVGKPIMEAKREW